MRFFKELFKKLHKKDGVTGEDIAIAIAIIVTTMGVITAIYVNLINKSRDSIRHSNAVRIATGIVENIERLPYDYVISTCSVTYDEVENTSGIVSNGEKLFDYTIPKGYKAIVTATPSESSELPDIARNIVVKVEYKANKRNKTITLYTTKEKELLEQTNKPDVTMIKGYGEDNRYYYPIKKVNEKYYVTDLNDPEWYNYDVGNYALIFATNTDNISLGTEYTTINSLDIYVWIPRFGYLITEVDNGGETEIETELKFFYEASDYPIEYSSFTVGDYATIWGYMPNFEVDVTTITYYENMTDSRENFETNDGLTGVWYKLGDTTGKAHKLADSLNNSEEYHCSNVIIPEVST